MSNFIKPNFCPNYEDYQDYGQTSCTLKHWPDMWPEERAAEAGVYRERERMKEQRFFMEDDEVIRTIMHFRLKPHLPEHILKVALVSLADEQGWEVKKHFGLSTIYKTSNEEEATCMAVRQRATAARQSGNL